MKKTERYIFVDDETMRIVVDFFKGRAYFHVRMKRWSVSVCKAFIARYADLLRVLEAIGFASLYAYIPEHNAKLYKFQTKCGFREWKRQSGWIMSVRNTHA